MFKTEKHPALGLSTSPNCARASRPLRMQYRSSSSTSCLRPCSPSSSTSAAAFLTMAVPANVAVCPRFLSHRYCVRVL